MMITGLVVKQRSDITNSVGQEEVVMWLRRQKSCCRRYRYLMMVVGGSLSIKRRREGNVAFIEITAQFSMNRVFNRLAPLLSPSPFVGHAILLHPQLMQFSSETCVDFFCFSIIGSNCERQ